VTLRQTLGHDARDDHEAVRKHQSAEHGRERHNGLGYDVADDDAAARAGGLKRIGVKDRQPRLDAVGPSVLYGHSPREAVNLRGPDGACPKTERRYAEDTGACANIHDLVARPDNAVEQLQAEARGGMAPGPEGHSGVYEHDRAFGLALGRLPRWSDQQAATYSARVMVLSPLVQPVNVRHVPDYHIGDGRESVSGEIAKGRSEGRELALHAVQDGQPAAHLERVRSDRVRDLGRYPGTSDVEQGGGYSLFGVVRSSDGDLGPAHVQWVSGRS